MSKIGSNIRKIRMVKGLSQSAFADLFGLSRASIGAYEEGRAEPKVDAVIGIAKYFSLTLDDIYKKEVTVNQLTNFKLPESEDQLQEMTNSGKLLQLNYVSASQLMNRVELELRLTSKQDWTKIAFPELSISATHFIELNGLIVKGILEQNVRAAIGNLNHEPKLDTTLLVVTTTEILYGTYKGNEGGLQLELIDGTIREGLTTLLFSMEVKLLITDPSYKKSTERLFILPNH